MPVDIRATVTCSLGTLISGSISDDYLQGNGLVKTRGTVEISGTITPAIGTVVTFSYTKGGVTRNIPRKLRVLSSFADPFRRTTSVELGCKLTYLQDLKEPIDWSVFDDPANSSYTEADSKIVTLPISAASVMTKCLTELGITASSSPLTNYFSIGEFDFSAGYVQVLADLLVSECYFGYLNYNEVLQIVNLQTTNDTGPVYTQSEIIDLSQINSGQIPGEAVTVSYSTLKFKAPSIDTVPDPVDPADQAAREQLERLNWQRQTTISGPVTYDLGPRSFTGMEVVETVTRYTQINNQNVPTSIRSTTSASSAKGGGRIATDYLTNGINFNATQVTEKVEDTTFTYDKDANKIREEVVTYLNVLSFFGSLTLDFVFSSTDYVTFSDGFIASEKRISTFNKSGNVELQTTSDYVTWIKTIPGQQAVAAYTQSGLLNTSGAVSAFANKVANAGLVHVNTTTRIATSDATQAKPPSVPNAEQSKDGDPNNNYRTESTAELELALGSPTAKRRVEFSLPYAPDDRNSGPTGGPFTVVRSDAATKASNYGRIQNRLLLGNRNGMNIQLAPEKLPEAPFASMYVQANGLTGQYRANGNQWAFDSTGIACSTDALFWNAVGGTGTFWFPVAPGITTLPATPATVDGQLTPTTLTPPYNETADTAATVRARLDVTTFAYPLTLLTNLPVVIRTKNKVSPKFLDCATGSFTLTGNAATLARGAKLAAGTGTFTLTGIDATLTYTP